MTFDECQRALVPIRRRQGTRFPTIRIDYGGAVYHGRLARADSDPEHRQAARTPYGVLVLEAPGLARGPQTVLQIANLESHAIRDAESN